MGTKRLTRSLKMKYDYSYSCECSGENGAYGSKRAAVEAAKDHALNDKRCGVKNPTVFIDQYNLEEGELSGSYSKMRIATPAKR